MRYALLCRTSVVICGAAAMIVASLWAQAPAQPKGATPQAQPKGQRDAVAEAQTPRRVEGKRPEQKLTDQDREERFSGARRRKDGSRALILCAIR